MKTEAFLQALREHLKSLPANEVEDILRDQREYLQDAVRAGRSEDEATASLGDPKIFAANLLAESRIKSAEQAPSLSGQMKNTLGAAIAILALAPLNFLFFAGPFLIACCLLIAGWAASFGFFVAAWALMILFLMKLAFLSVGLWTHLSAFFFTVGWIGASLLAFLVMAQASRWFLKGTLSYLKWNVHFIQGRQNVGPASEAL